ncbi:MAG: TM2 domain-containing protein [Muribaculaceae bacterium]|nr:TM2 domain-containing protein [Muribaculaceae bacterium]
MTNEQIAQFFKVHGDKFRQSDLPQIKVLLENVSELRVTELIAAPYKSPMIMTVIAWLGGAFGIDRFMFGQLGWGVAKLITFGGCGLWTLVDIFTAMDRTRTYNMNILQELL